MTFVEEDVAEDTTWTAEDGPYRVIRDVEVAAGSTLVIEPGTEVQFAEGTTLSVAGSLYANGTDTAGVTFATTPGASADSRWTTLRYEGNRSSTLSVANTTIRDARDGITVASDAGQIVVRDSTVRDISRHGIAVTDVATTPAIDVRGSSFAAIGGHGVAATPSTGALEAISLRPSTSERDETASHVLTLEPGVETTGDEVVLAYGRHGDVSGIGASDVGRFGIDVDDDGDLEQGLSSRITDLTVDDGTVRISLSESVTIPGDGRLVLELSGVRNPATRGIYRVDVGIDADGVPQLSNGVHAPLAIGAITTEYAETTVVEPTTVRSLSVQKTSFDDVGGDGVRLDADSISRLRLGGNTLEAVDGAGIGLRGRTIDGSLRSNRIRAGAAGIHIAVRDGVGLLTIANNEVRESATGLSVRQSGSRVRANLDMAIDHNVFADNAGHGIRVNAARGRLTGGSISNNTLRDNKRDGASLVVDGIDGVRIADNLIHDNGDDGVSLRTRGVASTALTENEFARNQGDGLAIDARGSIRELSVRNVTASDNGGHGLAIHTDIVAHDVTIANDRITNNGGAGVLVTSPLTHGGRVAITDSLVAANAYGIHIGGALRANVSKNAVVFNTNEHVEPVPIEGVQPGTGISVTEGAAGVVFDRGDAAVRLSELVANQRVDVQLETVGPNVETAVVLRTDGDGHTRLREEAALPVATLLRDLPTGVALSTADDAGVSVAGNDVYGHERGMTVDVDPLIDANTTGRLLVEDLRTVAAENTYWGVGTGPFHDSILPSGDGDAVLTHAGWVDFVPYATAPHRERHERPVAALSAPDTAVPNETVIIDGGDSTASTGTVARYHFVVDGADRSAGTGSTYAFEMPSDPVTARLVVEDELGVDGANSATVTIQPAPPETTTETTGAPTETTTGAPTTEPGADGSGLAGTVVTVLGGLSYLIAVVLGGYGMVMTLRQRDPPYDGLTVHIFAVAAVVVWGVGGLLFGGAGIRLAALGGLLWAVLTGIAYVLATR
ncbi:hypothetical protein HLASF_0428 [Halanaeroarchaeum sulfurireducens]|uniref:Right handed beta helix domain-containing protein n=1 Tax=Halanaeroarchaeum sulfurireducens TaxID=1604004 RepID=A0A0F7PBB8_9EURY|nr:hypothetical protein HLASF_0428 [Halanaeroarchaeum sulfurireducens]ALG81335.1 hypothetical protein HLASA_0426 [Halanaeroarchaeum sulfurireducens]